MTERPVGGPGVRRGRTRACVALGIVLAWGWPAPAREALPADAAQALAEMRFGLAKLALEKSGASPERLAACDAMRAAFDAACANLKAGRWKPSARDLTGSSGRILGASPAGIEFRSGGMSMVMPWRSLKPLARQRFLEGAASRPDARVWLARAAYAAWSGLADRANEELDAASKAGAKLPEWLVAEVGELGEEEKAKAAAKLKPNGSAKSNGRRDRKAAGGGKGLMGSEDFEPSPQRPVGWRGDWTGRYPGATPPTMWSRRVKGITTGIRYQAAKPSARPGEAARPLEYFTIREWLVAGPFDAADPARDIDRDFLGGEAAAQPDEGDKAGGAAWKHVRTAMETQSGHAHNEGICRHLNVDFVHAFGKLSQESNPAKPWEGTRTRLEGDFENKVAYGHTYVFSPSGGRAGLRIPYVGAACKAWLNGSPVKVVKSQWDATPEVDLAAGWNRLLVKVSCVSGKGPEGQNAWVSKWRFAAYISPPTPVSYETTNVAWMTRVTGRSMSQPIVVGDKVLFGSSISDLVCLSKADGRVLWIRSNTPWDALSEDEKREHRDRIGPLAAELERLNAEATKAIGAMVSPQGMTSDQQAQLDRLLKEKVDAEQKIHQAFVRIDRKRFPPMTGNEVTSSNATPVSDGSRVYWACGGGMKGPGASVVACFDLDGKRLWSHHEAFGAGEHGLHTSPVLVDGRLVYGANKSVVAFDAATGAVAWRQQIPQNLEFCGSSPQAVRIGGQSAVLTHHPILYRASDGAQLAAGTYSSFGDLTPVVEGGVIFNPAKFKTWGNDNVSLVAHQLPGAAAEGGKIQELWEIKHQDAFVPLRGPTYQVASPLYVDGILYVIDMSGGLFAVDVGARKGIWRLWLDCYNRYDRYLYGFAASPALGGRNIYLVDDSGYTIIIEPGREYREVGRNVLENIHLSGQGGNPCRQESFYTAPVFDGASIYLKGEEYLYCIRER